MTNKRRSFPKAYFTLMKFEYATLPGTLHMCIYYRNRYHLIQLKSNILTKNRPMNCNKLK